MSAPTTTGSTTTVDESTSSAPAPAPPSATWERCDNPEGFSISYPSDWSVNDGAVTSACSLFDPETFTVPDATDARVAAISAHVESVPFHEVAAPGDETDRAVTAVDGHQAVRTVGPAGELYGEDTEITTYAIDLAIGVDDGPGTLIVDTVDLESIGYDEAVSVLDRMVRTIDLTGVEEAPDDVVARYEGAAPFSAALVVTEGEPCLTVPTQNDPTTECFTEPSADALRFADFSDDLFSAFGGVVGEDVFRVDAVTDAEDETGTLSFLPAGTGEAGVRAFAMPIELSGVERLEWYGLDGQALGQRVLDEESDIEAVDSFRSTPVRTDDFPATGRPSFLQDVRVASHDGFDRVVFEFSDDGEAFSYEIVSAEEVRATSGETVAVEGEALLRVTMNPAAGVDLSGEEPRVTYDGPDEITPGSTSSVREVTLVEDFESTLTWAVGLSGDREIAVATLAEPRRLVIDVAVSG